MEWMEEYTAVCREWARAQRLTEICQRQWLAERRALESELLRLRGALLVLRTAWLWGLKPQGSCWPRQHQHHATSTAPTSDNTDRLSAAAIAQRALCQAGCQGHGHTWLGDDGLCRLLGTPCDGVTANAALTTARP